MFEVSLEEYAMVTGYNNIFHDWLKATGGLGSTSSLITTHFYMLKRDQRRY